MPTDLPEDKSEGGIFSVEFPFQMTLTCVKLTNKKTKPNQHKDKVAAIYCRQKKIQCAERTSSLSWRKVCGVQGKETEQILAIVAQTKSFQEKARNNFHMIQ